MMRFTMSTARRHSNGQRAVVILAWALAALLMEVAPVAQPFTLDWTNTDGSANTSSGGDFTVSATIGQPDAGLLAGGEYVLEGGFWPGLVVPSEDVPTLLIQFLEGGPTISWSPATPGFTLETTDDLGGGAWLPAPTPDENPTLLLPNDSAQFFRLVKRPVGPLSLLQN